MEGHLFGLEGVELDLGEPAFVDFAPAIDARLGFLGFAAVETAEKTIGVVTRSDGAIGGASEGLDGVTAQQLVPIMIEEIAGGEDVAPGDFTAVSHHDADDAFALQT